jgi:hypothetical protein
MKQLFDETHPYAKDDRRRTLWYQLDESDGVAFLFSEPEEYGVSFLKPSDYTPLAKLLLEAARKDLADEAAKDVSETHWVFYTNRSDKDAIGETVRFTVMLRHKGGQFDCDIQYSDFLFASAYDEIMKIKQSIVQTIKKQY